MSADLTNEVIPETEKTSSDPQLENKRSTAESSTVSSEETVPQKNPGEPFSNWEIFKTVPCSSIKPAYLYSQKSTLKSESPSLEKSYSPNTWFTKFK